MMRMLFFKSMYQKLTKKWYPVLVTVNDPVETQELAERVARESSMSPGDVHNVIRTMVPIMTDYLRDGRPVHLEGFGWFRFTCQATGTGVDTEEEVNAQQITGVRVQFTPERERNMGGGYTRALVDNLSFSKWQGDDADLMPDDDEDDSGQGGGEGTLG